MENEENGEFYLDYIVRDSAITLHFTVSDDLNFKTLSFGYVGNQGAKKKTLELSLTTSQFSVELEFTNRDLPIRMAFVDVLDGDEQKNLAKVEFIQNSYLQLQNRPNDLQTLAFISKQSASDENVPYNIRCTMAVIYAYKSLDLKRDDYISDSQTILNELLVDIEKLSVNNHVRSNRANVKLSMITVLLHCSIYFSNKNDFSALIENLLNSWILSSERADLILDSMTYNLVKILNILAFIFFERSRIEGLNYIVEINMALLSNALRPRGITKLNVNEYAVLDSVHKDVVRGMLLRTLLNGDNIADGYITKHLLKDANGNFLKEISENLFRTQASQKLLLERLRELALSFSVVDLDNLSLTLSKVNWK